MFLHFHRGRKRGKREIVKPRFFVLRRRTLTFGAALLMAVLGGVHVEEMSLLLEAESVCVACLLPEDDADRPARLPSHSLLPLP